MTCGLDSCLNMSLTKMLIAGTNHFFEIMDELLLDSQAGDI